MKGPGREEEGALSLAALLWSLGQQALADSGLFG